MKRKYMIMAAGLLTLSLSACHIEYSEDITLPSDEESETAKNQTSINLGYTDETYTDYFTLCKEKYEEEHKGVIINLNLMSPTDYIKNISDNSFSGEEITDVYMVNNSDLGTASLAGVAKKNTSDNFSEDNYCQTALNACSYKGNLIAYPMGYDTAFLVYNSEYLSAENTKTFEDIKKYSENATFSAEDASVIETIFKCNISQLFLNYGFVGDGIATGGIYGDDASEFVVNSAESVEDMNNYLALIDYFSISSKTSYTGCLKKFSSGKFLSTIVSSDALPSLKEATIDFSVAAFPDYEKSSPTSPLSITTALVVNPYSANDDIAEDFADYATYYMADEFFNSCGVLSAKKDVEYDTKYLGDIYASYEKSTPKNKLLYGEQVYPLIEIALHNVVAGNDTQKELEAIDDYMKTQFD